MLDTSAVWDGKFGYVFGGDYGCASGWLCDPIYRHNTGDDALLTRPVVLPSARAYTSAVWAAASTAPWWSPRR